MLVTDDLAGAEAAIREVWGGALYVSEAERSLRDLQAIQEEVFSAHPSVFGGGVDEIANRLELRTVLVTNELRAELEERYGDAVAIEALLRPAAD